MSHDNFKRLKFCWACTICTRYVD